MTQLPVPDDFGRRDSVALAVLLLAGVGLPLWLASASGAIGIPASDDWVYSQGAESLFRSGMISMGGHTAASIGQLVLVQPLLWLSGGDPWAFAAFGLVMAGIAIASSYALARRFLGTASSVMVVLLVIAFPGLSRESATFMTDVPAFALMAVCLLQGTRWLQGEGTRLTLVTSVAAGLLAVSIREFAIAAPVAVLIVAWARNKADERTWLGGVSAAFACGILVLLVIAASIPGSGGVPDPAIGGLLQVPPVFATLAAVLLPAIALGVGRRIATFSPTHILLGASLACLTLIVSWGSPIGMWMERGFGGDFLLSGARNRVFDAGAWVFSRQLAVLAAILLAASFFRWGHHKLVGARHIDGARAAVMRIVQRDDAILVLFLLAYTSELIAFAPIWIYDRYLIPMVPAAAILLLRGRPQLSRFGWSLPISHAAFAWLAFSAFVIAANSFAYDAARWREGEAAVAIGYDPHTVDAGYEWIGYYGSLPAASLVPMDRTSLLGTRWALIRPCAILSSSPLEDSGLSLVHVNQVAYLRYLFFGPEESLYLYAAPRDGCPGLPTSSWSH